LAAAHPQQKSVHFTGHVFRYYLKGSGYSRARAQLTALWANGETKELFNELTEKLVGPGVTAEHIARAFVRKHGGYVPRG
jgi:hypothetical protein